jgi:hypothetical protein
VVVTNVAEGAAEGDFRPLTFELVMENSGDTFAFGRDEESGRFGTTRLDAAGQPTDFAPFAVQLSNGGQLFANWLFRKALDPNQPREVIIPPGFRLVGVARVDFPLQATPSRLTIRAGEPPAEAEVVSYNYAEISQPPAQTPEVPGGPADLPALPATLTVGATTLTVTGANRPESVEGASCTPPPGHRLLVLDVTAKTTGGPLPADALNRLLVFDRDLNLYRSVSSATGDLNAALVPGAQCSGRPSKALALGQAGTGQEADGILVYIVREDSDPLRLAALDDPTQGTGKVYRLP